MKNDGRVHWAVRVLLAAGAGLALCLYAAVLVLAVVPSLAAAVLYGLGRLALPPPRLRVLAAAPR